MSESRRTLLEIKDAGELVVGALLRDSHSLYRVTLLSRHAVMLQQLDERGEVTVPFTHCDFHADCAYVMVGGGSL